MGRIGKKKRMKAFKQAMIDIEKNLKLKVFPNFKRSDGSPKKNQEKYYEFYNRCSRESIDAVRRFINDCVSNYPRGEAVDLVSRLRSRDDTHFRSATFELFLHELLLRLGYQLIPHPELNNGSNNKPDFLVKGKDSEEFYLEAIAVSELNELDQGGEARKGVVLDILLDAPHENFMIDIGDSGSPNSPPSGKKLKNKIHQWLDSLDPDTIAREIDSDGFYSIEPFRWIHDGWALEIRPIPIKKESRGKSTNLIGMSGVGGGFIDTWSPIRDAVRTKGGRYGVLDKPYIVAVSIDSFHLERMDEMQALYGQEQFKIKRDGSGKPTFSRAPNGAWYGINGAQYTRVSAAWIFNRFQASSLASSNCTLYVNPWATLKSPESLTCFPHALPEGNRMNWVEGIKIKDVFGMSDSWPENC